MRQLDNFPHVPPGKRVFLSGRTGTGKSYLARWLAERSKSQPWIILNPKNTEAFKDFGVKVYKIDMKKIIDLLRKGQNVNLIPDPIYCDADTLDAIIFDLCNSLKNFGIIIDEAYTLHKGGRCGVGLTALLTRGRELKQSCIMCAQRPAWLSGFCISEADYIASLRLTIEEDRIRIAKASGYAEFQDLNLGEHDWIWYDVAKEKVRFFEPISI